MGKPKEKRKEQARRQLAKSKQQARRRLLMHSLKPLFFAILAWLVVNILVHIPVIQKPFNAFFISFTTHSAYWFGKILFLPVEMRNVPFLSVNGFPLMVIMECTAYTFYIFGVAVVAFSRWPLRHKLISLVTILLGIFVINNFRFLAVGFVGSYRPDMVDLLHDVVWNVVFALMVFALWWWREESARKLIASEKHQAG